MKKVAETAFPSLIRDMQMSLNWKAVAILYHMATLRIGSVEYPIQLKLLREYRYVECELPELELG